MPTNNATRAKGMLGFAKPKSASDPDGDPKSAAFMKKVASGAVYDYRSRWVTMLANESTPLQINPDNQTDPLDIGEWDGVTSTFTPSDAATLSKALNKHLLQVARHFFGSLKRKFARESQADIAAGDVGKTPSEVEAEAAVAAAAENVTEMGEDSADDPI